MQHTPDRNGQGPCYLLRIVFLQSRDRSPYAVRKKAVNRSTIITQPLQVPLQCPDVGRVFDQLTSRHRIISRSTSIARREIRFVNSRPALMKKAPVVARRQDIIRVKKRHVKKRIVIVCANTKYVASPKLQPNPSSTSNRMLFFLIGLLGF